MPQALILSILLLLTACSEKKTKSTIKLHGSTMGTQYHITLIAPKNRHTNIDELKEQVDDLLLKINQQMSTYIPSSEISQFNLYKQQDWFPISNDFAQVVSNAQNISNLTNGAFDITISPLIDLWGFGAKTQLKIPTDKQITQALQSIGYQYLAVRNEPPALRKLNKNLRIDLSAIAKGFAVDKITGLISQRGYSNFLVEIGGELHSQGSNHKNLPWKIGIVTPNSGISPINNTLLTSNLSIATSGDYQNYFIKDGLRYSHTINPTTGKPVTHKLASITVLHESTMIADAYATALMVMGDKKGKAFSKENHLRINMIIRSASEYQSWQNIDDTKIPQSSQKCQKQGGCVYLE